MPLKKKCSLCLRKPNTQNNNYLEQMMDEYSKLGNILGTLKTKNDGTVSKNQKRVIKKMKKLFIKILNTRNQNNETPKPKTQNNKPKSNSEKPMTRRMKGVKGNTVVKRLNFNK